jgi:hypothetical protein
VGKPKQNFITVSTVSIGALLNMGDLIGSVALNGMQEENS